MPKRTPEETLTILTIPALKSIAKDYHIRGLGQFTKKDLIKKIAPHYNHAIEKRCAEWIAGRGPKVVSKASREAQVHSAMIRSYVKALKPDDDIDLCVNGKTASCSIDSGGEFWHRPLQFAAKGKVVANTKDEDGGQNLKVKLTEYLPVDMTSGSYVRPSIGKTESLYYRSAKESRSGKAGYSGNGFMLVIPE
jgi:hypothetical protein